MSAFGMIESFFFLSLGVVFVLIVLLVYHFKQRITTIEQKSDTMFDIVQNLAKELTSIKGRLVTPNYVINRDGISQSVVYGGEDKESEDESEDEDDSEDEIEDESEDEDDSDNKIKVIEIGDYKAASMDNIQEPKEEPSTDSDTEPEIVELNENETDKIKILKVDSNPESDTIALKKMAVGDLRTLAVSKGVCSDAGKLSKVELVKILSKK